MAVLREHRKKQFELRLGLGADRPDPDALVFCREIGLPMLPDNLSRDWVRAKALGLPKVMFHALRHTHVSALIAAGPDIVTIGRRIGHGSSTTTLNAYAHLFNASDQAAANAIEAAIRRTRRA